VYRLTYNDDVAAGQLAVLHALIVNASYRTDRMPATAPNALSAVLALCKITECKVIRQFHYHALRLFDDNSTGGNFFKRGQSGGQVRPEAGYRSRMLVIART